MLCVVNKKLVIFSQTKWLIFTDKIMFYPRSLQKNLLLSLQMKKANFPTLPLKTIPIFPHFIPLPPLLKKHHRK